MIRVCGGAVRGSGRPRGVYEMLRPDHAGVANAIGAAIGQVGVEVARIYNIPDGDARTAAIADAEAQARAPAASAGPDPDSTTVLHTTAAPLHALLGVPAPIVCLSIALLPLWDVRRLLP